MEQLLLDSRRKVERVSPFVTVLMLGKFDFFLTAYPASFLPLRCKKLAVFRIQIDFAPQWISTLVSECLYEAIDSGKS